MILWSGWHVAPAGIERIRLEHRETTQCPCVAILRGLKGEFPCIDTAGHAGDHVFALQFAELKAAP